MNERSIDGDAIWPRPASPKFVASLSPTVLAYLGDAVYELYVRKRVLLESTDLHVDRLHRKVVAKVSAVGQAKALDAIDTWLTDEEAGVVRRARNAKMTVPKGMSPAIYHRSTSFEALVGYLYLTGRDERLRHLLEKAIGEPQS